MRCYSEKDVGLYKTSWHIASKFSGHTGCADFGVVFTSRVNAFLLLFGSICHEEGFGFPLCGGSDLMWGQCHYVRVSDLMWGTVPLCEGQWPYVWDIDFTVTVPASEDVITSCTRLHLTQSQIATLAARM